LFSHFSCHLQADILFGFSVVQRTGGTNLINSTKQVENEQKAELPSKQGATPEQASALEESIFKLSGQLSTISRNQKYFRTRENRNFSTVRSTERRIFNFSVIESLMMISMAGLQVFIVRFFFQGARKGKYPCGAVQTVHSCLPLLLWFDESELNSRLSWLPGLKVGKLTDRIGYV
jgi:hypothetical protein